MNYTLKPFSSSIFVPNRSIKIKNYKDFKFFFSAVTKTLNKGKGFGFIKVDVYSYSSTFSLQTTYPHGNLNIVHHEASI